MSKIIFITSQKEIKLNHLGIEKIEPNSYMLKHYPHLKRFNHIYNFEGFDNSISYKQLINYLLNQSENNAVSLLVLWQTQNLEEIREYNDCMQHKNIITLDNDSNIYDLIYSLERDSLLPSTEYEFIK